MSRYVDIDKVLKELHLNHKDVIYIDKNECAKRIEKIPSIDIVRCRECKHRPIKEDADGENYGFNLIEPNDGDERCPCLVSDGWYSWMPKDDFYCGFGEREDE